MNIPWEALGTLFLALIGFIVWLTKISVKLDIGLSTMSEIKATITIIESTYVKVPDFAKELGRIEQSVQTAHKRIDELKRLGYDVNRELKDR